MALSRAQTISSILSDINNNKPVDREIVIDSLDPYNFLEFMCILQLNPSIKKITIFKINDAEALNPEYAEMMEAIVEVNTTLRSLDFGNDVLPEKIASPFVKELGQFNFDELHLKGSGKIPQQFDFYRARNELLLKVIQFYLLGYISKAETSNDVELQKSAKLLKNTLRSYASISLTLPDLIKIIETHTKDCSEIGSEAYKDFSELSEFLSNMASTCIECATSPIQYLVSKGDIPALMLLCQNGFQEYLKLENIRGMPSICYVPFAKKSGDVLTLIDFIKKSGVDVNSKSHEGLTAIHFAAIGNNPAAIQRLYELGADINVVSNYGDSPLSLALSCGNMAAAEALMKLGANTKDVEKTKRKREFLTVFGKKKLEDVSKKEESMEGGWPRETYIILMKYLKEFMAEYFAKKLLPEAVKKSQTILFNRILNVLQAAHEKNFNTNEQIITSLQMMKPMDKEYYYTGSALHLMGVRIMKNENGDFVLSISERGEFFKFFTSVSDRKSFTVKQIVVPQTKIKEVAKLLIQALEFGQKKAGDILFKKIPEICGNDYTDYTLIEQSAMKVGHCFFSNPLTLFYLELMQEFGDPDKQVAINMFKDFTLFMREKSTLSFEEVADKTEDQILIAEAKKVIQRKQEKMHPATTANVTPPSTSKKP